MNQTILQTFYWEMQEEPYSNAYPEEKNLWQLLEKRAAKIAKTGFTGVWLPPANKGHAGIYDVGYGTYDLWDLGEFKQKGSIRTKYGTKEDLEKAITALHAEELKVYYDAVLNHRFGADELEEVEVNNGKKAKVWTKFNFPGRGNHYSYYKYNWNSFDGVDWNASTKKIGKYLLQGKSWDWSYDDDYLMGADIDYTNPNVKEDVISWGKWIINDINFDGFRLDAVKHIDNGFISDWINEIEKSTDKNLFFVGEAWLNGVEQLIDYLNQIGHPLLNVFDFPLRRAFVEMVNGNLDMRWLGGRGLVNQEGYKDRAVTFVDTHDTDRDLPNEYNTQSISNFKYQAYTYILMRENGIPVVYWKDYYTRKMKEKIDVLLAARNKFAYGAGFETDSNDQQTYSYIREGNEEIKKSGLVMMITRNNSGRIISKKINSLKPKTTFYDFTGHIEKKVTTDEEGFADFMVRGQEGRGWSIWVELQ